MKALLGCLHWNLEDNYVMWLLDWIWTNPTSTWQMEHILWLPCRCLEKREELLLRDRGASVEVTDDQTSVSITTCSKRTVLRATLSLYTFICLKDSYLDLSYIKAFFFYLKDEVSNGCCDQIMPMSFSFRVSRLFWLSSLEVLFKSFSDMSNIKKYTHRVQTQCFATTSNSSFYILQTVL